MGVQKTSELAVTTVETSTLQVAKSSLSNIDVLDGEERADRVGLLPLTNTPSSVAVEGKGGKANVTIQLSPIRTPTSHELIFSRSTRPPKRHRLIFASNMKGGGEPVGKHTDA